MAIDLQELRGMTVDEIDAKATELKKELMNLRLQLGTAKLDKVHRIGELRKEIARVKTIKNQVRRKAMESKNG